MQKQLLSGLRIVIWFHIVLGLILGLGYFLIPTTLLNLLTWPSMDTYFTRMIGAAVLGFVAAGWFALQANDWEKVKIYVQAEIVWTILGTLATIWGMLTESLPIIGWLNTIILAIFAVAFTYFYIQEERVPTQQFKPAPR